MCSWCRYLPHHCMTPADIWQHFEHIIAPEIRKQQLGKHHHPEARSLGELISSFSEAAPIHEVQKYFWLLLHYTNSLSTCVWFYGPGVANSEPISEVQGAIISTTIPCVRGGCGSKGVFGCPVPLLHTTWEWKGAAPGSQEVPHLIVSHLLVSHHLLGTKM